MNPAAPTAASAPAALYQHLIRDTVAQSSHLMERAIESTRHALRAHEDRAHTPGDRHAALHARQHLVRLAFVMRERFPDTLQQVLTERAVQQQGTRSLFEVHFDELELMDESQISQSVERARAGQVVNEAVQAPLAELNALMSTAQGHTSVSPDHNPLHPQVFLHALQTVVGQMQVPEQVRRDWMWHLAEALGNELRTLYLDLIGQLRNAGVKPAGYAMRQASGAYAYLQPTGQNGSAPGFGPETRPWDARDAEAASTPAELQVPQLPVTPPAPSESLLTLDRLRRLLAGELSETPPPTSNDSFFSRFSLEIQKAEAQADAPPADFDITVPAAFEALQEMNQVDHMVQRLGSQRQQGPHDAPAGADPVRMALRSSTAGLGQALSLEVVALMVDNLANDQRLLWPVKQLVKELEPALLQLALADPRFFSDKEHPARRLLQEMTDRSLAFDSLEADGFESFMQPLIEIVRPLAHGPIDSKAPFEQALEQVRGAWAEGTQQHERDRSRAIDALRNSDRRQLLAAQIVRDLWLHPQLDRVPKDIQRFLEGPWAQVMAQARLADTTGNSDPGRYRELVDALLWSAQPAQTQSNVGRLARLVPKLLSRLREGLATIEYPATKAAAFFDLLMKLHQQAFASAPATAAAPAAPATATRSGAYPSRVDPSEAMLSRFMAADAEPSAPPPRSTLGGAPGSAAAEMGIGTWVDMRVAGKWERTQLSWIDPDSGVLLFTSASGHTQSMSQQLLNKLKAQGAMRVVAQQTMMDGALDAVAQAAMRNSVDVRR